VTLEIDIAAGAPIERIELRNRTEVLETWRPYGQTQLGRRIRIIWEGSEYRGRGRQTVWDGSATFSGNTVASFSPINLWNLDKTVRQTAPGTLEWRALTTGGFGGADILLADARAGTLEIAAGLVNARVNVADIGLEDTVLDTGDGIKRRMRLFRLPEHNEALSARFSRRIRRNAAGEDALYVCATLEDGHMAWSSPTYLLR
jgi:hypothetical protein